MVTSGDKTQDKPLQDIGGKGLFIKELEEALLDGRADFAVHSIKDVPAVIADSLFLAAIPRREDPRDALVTRTGAPLAELPAGARMGTGSLRRARDPERAAGSRGGAGPRQRGHAAPQGGRGTLRRGGARARGAQAARARGARDGDPGSGGVAARDRAGRARDRVPQGRRADDRGPRGDRAPGDVALRDRGARGDGGGGRELPDAGGRFRGEERGSDAAARAARGAGRERSAARASGSWRGRRTRQRRRGSGARRATSSCGGAPRRRSGRGRAARNWLLPARRAGTWRSCCTRTCRTCGTRSTSDRWRSGGSTRRSGRRTCRCSICSIGWRTRGSRRPFSLSVSPPLAAMWSDPLLARAVAGSPRSDAGGRGARDRGWGSGAGRLSRRSVHHLGLLERAEATLDRHGGDVLGAFARHHREGRLHLFTTTATHAFLPALAPSPEWVRAQIALGKPRVRGAVGDRGAGALAAGVRVRAVDRSAARGGGDPVVGAGRSRDRARGAAARRGHDRRGRAARGSGGRARGAALADPVASRRRVFRSRSVGGARGVGDGGVSVDPAYRELHRDLGFDAREEDLLGELGPFGARVATGLKLHRITGPGHEKAPYEPRIARARAGRTPRRSWGIARGCSRALRRGDATRGSLRRSRWRRSTRSCSGISGTRGRCFSKRCAAAPRGERGARGGPAAVTLGEGFERHASGACAGSRRLRRGEKGDSAATWTGPRTAPLWRHVHHAAEDGSGCGTRCCAKRQGDPGALRGEALDQAIVEALLLQSSDFAFMIHRGTTADYARARVAEHARNAGRLAGLAIAETREPGGRGSGLVEAVRERTPFLRGARGGPPPCAAAVIGGEVAAGEGGRSGQGRARRVARVRRERLHSERNIRRQHSPAVATTHEKKGSKPVSGGAAFFAAPECRSVDGDGDIG